VRMPEALLVAPEFGTPHAFETRHGDVTSVLPGPTLRLRQVHGRAVHVIDGDTCVDDYQAEEIERRPAGDALITDLPGITLAVATADCVPVLLHDPAVGAIAAVHAGWRGIAAEIVPAAVAAMQTAFGSRPENCRAVVGPCVGPVAYRVGPEVSQQFSAIGLPLDVFRAAETDSAGKTTALCDLGRAATWQLRNQGIPASGIWLAGRCTVSEPELFHSYRRDREAAGRMTAAIALV